MKTFDQKKIDDELNRLGDLGWELVTTTLNTSTYNVMLILKNTEANLNLA